VLHIDVLLMDRRSLNVHLSLILLAGNSIDILAQVIEKNPLCLRGFLHTMLVIRFELSEISLQDLQGNELLNGLLWYLDAVLNRFAISLPQVLDPDKLDDS